VSRGLLLIDGSNIAHAANNGGALKVGDLPTQAIFGVLRTLRPMMSIYTMLTPVVLWDGASWRRMAFSEYKANRDKVATKPHELKAEALRKDFKKQLPYIKQAIKLLGIKQMEALNYEADDLAGMITQRLEKSGKRGVMISGDKDWVQLLSPNVAWIDPVRDYRLTLKTLESKLGFHPEKKDITVVKDGKEIEGWVGVPSPRAWLEMKCLMGDTSDNIPGVGKIGPKGAIDFVHAYGSFASFINQCADKSIDTAKLPKNLRDFSESDEKQEIFRRNMRLMDLRTTERPIPIALNTVQEPLDPIAFETFCKDMLFNSITNDMEGWLQPFMPQDALKVAA
jgi:5'-3' exonuclease